MAEVPSPVRAIFRVAWACTLETAAGKLRNLTVDSLWNSLTRNESIQRCGLLSCSSEIRFACSGTKHDGAHIRPCRGRLDSPSLWPP